MNSEVKRKKQKLGLIYGLTAGLAFAIFAWGIDAFLLARSHANFYWIKFVPGLVVCLVSGGLAGWLTTTFEKHGPAAIFWGGLGLLYAWMVVWLPLTGSLDIIKSLDPSLVNFFDFTQVKDLYQFRLVSIVVVGLASLLCGLLEINLILQAVHSTHGLSMVIALLICIFLFGIAGSATDQMINLNFREPVQVVNQMIQFAADNQGVEVPKQTARKMHLSSVNQIKALIQKKRSLLLVGFDENLGMMDTLVDFEGALVKCTTIYAQPTDCIILH